MQIINRTKEAITLEIVLANGTVDSINIQPQGRIKALPEGAVINPKKRRQYEQIAKFVDDVPKPTTTPGTTPDPEAGPNGSVTVTASAT